MTKNKMMRIAAALLVTVLLSTCVISGTFAKYTTDISASDTAIVARFAVKAFGVDGVANDTATVDIFNTVYDLAPDTDFTLDGTDDEDVKNATAGEAPIIAPGTWGKFAYTLKNESDVTVAYAVDYTVNEAGVPLQWSVDGTTWAEDLADVTATSMAIGSTEVTLTIYWKWAFEQTDVSTGDTTDTTLGSAGTASPSVSIKVTFTQVN